MIQIFRNPMITERNTDFESAVHTHTVFAVEQRLHKPQEIQLGHLPNAPVVRRVVLNRLNLSNRLLIFLIDILHRVAVLFPLLAQE